MTSQINTVFVILISCCIAHSAPVVRPSGEFEILKQRFQDISAELNQRQKGIIQHNWSESPEDDRKLLREADEAIRELHKKFPDSESWHSPNGMKPWQINQLRTRAQTALNQFIYLHSLVESKARLINQRDLQDRIASLQKYLKKSPGDAASITRGIKNLILLCSLLLFGSGGLAYWRLQKLAARRGTGHLQEWLSEKLNDQRYVLEQIRGDIGELSGPKDRERRHEDKAQRAPESPVAIPKSPQKTPLESLVGAYNAVVERISTSREFKQRYHTTTIGVLNSEARAHDYRIKPEFGTASNGEFLAIEQVKNEGGAYAVVPKLSSGFSEEKYKRGTLGYIFNCDDFDKGRKGSTIKLKKPAYFESDMLKESWRLVNKGDIGIAG